MSSFPSLGLTPGFPRVSAVPVLRGRQYSAGELYSLSSLPTDSIGNYALTLTNVVVGSAVQVEVASTGAVVTNTTAAAPSVALTIPAYAAGAAANSLRIKVRKGSASPYYQPYETLATAFVGAASIYVSQISDE